MRDRSFFPVRAVPKLSAADPETRTTPIAPRPGAVAIAAIVSALGRPKTGALQSLGDRPLLADGQDVVHQPVQHQACGEEEEEHAEGDGHDLHDLRLDRIRWLRIEARLDDHADAHQDQAARRIGSGVDKSLIHNMNGACRISTLPSSTQYRAMKTGIWITIGRQPPSGLIFSVLYNSIMAWCSF